MDVEPTEKVGRRGALTLRAQPNSAYSRPFNGCGLPAPERKPGSSPHQGLRGKADAFTYAGRTTTFVLTGVCE